VPPADALGWLRVAAAALLPTALLHGTRAPWTPVVLFAVGALTDFFDGVVARRGRGPTARGAVLDNAADIVFVLAGAGTGAVLGLVSPLVPVAIATAFGAYAVASVRGSVREGRWRIARSAIGHAAGVLNYALTGLVVAAVVWPVRPVTGLVGVAGGIVVAVNAAAVVGRVVPALSRALAPRVEGRRARWSRS
jgi:phosphatidylglycerophosphate synthase